MDIATESERKYGTPRRFAMPDLAGSAAAVGITRIGELRVHELDAVYYDTEDLRLARARVTLRQRTGGTDAGWHLKTPGGGDDRTEHRLPLGDGDDVPSELLGQVRAIVRGRSLRPVARLRTRRREYPLQDDAGRVLALVADDRVRAEADGDSQRWREVEVELVDGDRTILKALDAQLRAAGATPAGGASKLARALGRRLGEADGGQRVSGRVPGPVRAVVDYVRAQRDAIVGNDPAVRRGDPEAVHAMRVATRRMRSTLKTFSGGLWDRGRTDALRGELSWLAERLGGVRDRQVMAARLHAAVAGQPSRLVIAPIDARIGEHLDNDLHEGRRALGDALDDARYFTLLDQVDDLLATPPKAGVRGGWVRRKVTIALRRADDLLESASSAPLSAAAHDDPDEADEADHHCNEGFHDARKAYKQARYAIEVLAPAEGRPARQLVKQLTGLQDALGDHQDAVITAALLREYADRAHAEGDNAFTYGVLYARQRDDGEAALARVPAARDAAARRDLRRWLR